VKITNLTLGLGDRADGVAARTGAPLAMSLGYAAARPLEGVLFEITHYSADGKTVIATARAGHALHGVALAPPGGSVEFCCAELGLKPGGYHVAATARDAATLDIIDGWDGGTTLYVEPDVPIGGRFHMPHTWRVVRAAAADRSVPAATR